MHNAWTLRPSLPGAGARHTALPMPAEARRLATAAVACAVALTASLAAQTSAPAAPAPAAAGRFTLSVDSITRGPDLVGYPPSPDHRSPDGG